eukprot:5735557-Prymnesium_polylepis.1
MTRDCFLCTFALFCFQPAGVRKHVFSSRACCTGMVITQCETARCMAALRRCSARPVSSLCSVARIPDAT